MTQPPPLFTAKRRLMALPRLRQILPAAGILLVAFLLLRLEPVWISDSVALLLLLTAVLVSAAAFGFWTGILSAVSAFGLFNYLFVEPRLSLHAARPQDVVMLVAFLVAAGLTGFLAGRLREQLDAAEGRANVLEVLAESSGAFGEATTTPAILDIALHQIGRLAPLPVMVIARDGYAPVTSLPAGIVPAAEDLQAAGQAFSRGNTQYAANEGWNASKMSFHPLPPGREARVVIGHAPVPDHARDAEEREQAIAVVLQQASAALERSALAADAEAERIARDRQTLKAALLASLSHDLRTPLATILGAATTLRELEQNLPPEARADLLLAVEEEAQRLAGYVEKLLQMTRLMAGITLHLSPVDPGDCAMAAVGRARRAWPEAGITTALADLPLVRADAVLLEQLVFNLIENALRYAPGPMTVTGEVDGDRVLVTVADSGPGLPASVAGWLASDDLMPGTSGTGLGLPICKGIASALGGSLVARPPGGAPAALSLALPIAGTTLPQAEP